MDTTETLRSVRRPLATALALGLAVVALSAVADPAHGATPTVRAATGKAASDIQAAVDQYRADLGGGTTAGANGSFGGQRREINWDGVPDQFASPNDLPPDFFNTRSPRGVVFTFDAKGATFLVSGRAAANVPLRFGDINPTYTAEFGAFSPERIFASIGNTAYDIVFLVPGTQTPAVVRGFGAVFTDVDSPDSSSIEYFDAAGRSIHKEKAPATPGLGTFSFIGVSFDGAPQVAKVRVTAGGALLAGNVNDGPVGSRDKVALDDFLYGEPVAAAAATPTTVAATATTAAASATTVAAPSTKAAAKATVRKATKTTKKKATRTTKRKP